MTNLKVRFTNFAKIKVSFRCKLANQKNRIEQYSRRLCLVIDGVPSVDSETSNDVLEKVKQVCAVSNLEIPDSNQLELIEFANHTLTRSRR